MAPRIFTGITLVSARLLADPAPGSLPVTEGTDGLTIQGSATTPDPADSVVVVTLDR
jgi:hypothetical protein